MYGLNGNKNFCENGYVMGDEPLLSALFTTGNGYMGVRGSFEEFSSLRIQGIFVRGFIDEIIEVIEPFCVNEYLKKYYLDEQKLKNFERQETCVNMHDFTLVRVMIGEKIFYPWEGKIIQWERELDSHTAVYSRKVVWEDDEGNRTSLEFERFASFDDQHLYCQKVVITPINHSLPVRIISGIDTAVKTGGQRITRTLYSQTDCSRILHLFEAKNKFGFKAGYVVLHRFPEGKLEKYEQNGVYTISCFAEPCGRYVLEKFTRVLTSRDTGGDILEKLGEKIDEPKSYEECKQRHIKQYTDYFYPMDIKIEGDDESDGYLRFANYHTAISACRSDGIHGVAAKGLTGERYNQFIWWDQEIYQLPFFYYTAPETARHMLEYRYNLLGQSMKNAKAEGRRGARYAFCSSVTGEEKVWEYARHPFMQIHINSDVVYGFIRYYDSTGDREFMKEYGMEVIYNCLLYFADRVSLKNGRCEILQVTGTDEHHPFVDNDAYTNYSVHYGFKRFLKLCDELEYQIPQAVREEFADILNNLYLPKLENGLIPQFDGYFELNRELEVQGSGTHKNFQMKNTGLYHKSQIIKQPDVILLYTYLNVGLDRESYALNWDYYENLCEASSSLTYSPHAIASADNDRMLSFHNYFLKAIKVDVDDIFEVGWQGVHSGCLAGGYIAVLRGIFGIELDSEGKLNVNPRGMPFWKKVAARFFHMGTLFEISLESETVKIELLQGRPQTLFVYGCPWLIEREISFKCKKV